MKTLLLTLAILLAGCVVDSRPSGWDAASADDLVRFTTFYSWVAVAPMLLGLAIVAIAHLVLAGEMRGDHRRAHR